MSEIWRPASTATSDTLAEGIEVRVPVPESLARLVEFVDGMVLVSGDDLLQAMRSRPTPSAWYWCQRAPPVSPPSWSRGDDHLSGPCSYAPSGETGMMSRHCRGGI